ncbi:hypothetical protein D3C87_1727300 [compost metagenome]
MAPRRRNSGSRMVPMRSSPCTVSRRAPMARWKSSMASRMRSADGSSARPSALGANPCAVRAKSVRSSDSWKFFNCRLSAGWVTCRCSAARVRLPSRATAAKVRMCFKSMALSVAERG